jgi:prevent-host-death family protein
VHFDPFFGLNLGMRSVSATEAKQNFASVLDTAQRKPVLIRRHDRDVAVVLSAVEYERLRGLNIADYLRVAHEIGQHAGAEGMTPEILNELLKDDLSAPGH